MAGGRVRVPPRWFVVNGWGAAEPAWWLNLQAHPDAIVELAGGIRREVIGRAAVGEDRDGYGDVFAR